jgi:hypothetical protein
VIYQILSSTQIFLILFGTCTFSSLYWLNFPIFHFLYKHYLIDIQESELSLLRRGAAMALMPIVFLWGFWVNFGLNRGIFEYILS